MSEPQPKKTRCSICKEVGHNKTKCPKKPTYTELKVEAVNNDVFYILLESGIFGFTEYLPRVVAICKTPQEVVECTNTKLRTYFEQVKSEDESLESYDIPYLTLEKLQSLIKKDKVVVQLTSVTNVSSEDEDKHSIASYKLRMQVWNQGFYSAEDAKS